MKIKGPVRVAFTIDDPDLDATRLVPAPLAGGDVERHFPIFLLRP